MNTNLFLDCENLIGYLDSTVNVYHLIFVLVLQEPRYLYYQFVQMSSNQLQKQ